MVAAAACGLVAAAPETLPASARKPFSWRGGLTNLTPLSFLKLFRNGKNLALLTAATLLSNVGQGMSSFAELYRSKNPHGPPHESCTFCAVPSVIVDSQ